MFMAANSAAKYLNTYGIETVSIPLLVLQATHTTFLGSLAGGSPAIWRISRFGGWMSDDVRMLPQIEQTSAICALQERTKLKILSRPEGDRAFDQHDSLLLVKRNPCFNLRKWATAFSTRSNGIVPTTRPSRRTDSNSGGPAWASLGNDGVIPILVSTLEMDNLIFEEIFDVSFGIII
nr:hypothetical protein Iba_chr04fCG8430 [Ipomoea batatas]